MLIKLYIKRDHLGQCTLDLESWWAKTSGVPMRDTLIKLHYNHVRVAMPHGLLVNKWFTFFSKSLTLKVRRGKTNKNNSPYFVIKYNILMYLFVKYP